MNEQERIEQGFRKARNITRKYARTFYFASRFLPHEKRAASYALYALCRLSDESVDGTPCALQLEKLYTLQSDIDASYGDEPLEAPLLIAFRATVRKYAIPKNYFDELIQGMYMDLRNSRYAHFDELYAYCYKVAGVVGLIMLKVFGSRTPEAEAHAVSLGIAMQLTNILRDIREDFVRRRIYLPQDELARTGVSENDIAGGKMNERFRGLIQYQIERARRFYCLATPGIPLIDNARCRLVVTMMKGMYAGIVEAIEKNGYDVFLRRAHVSGLGKITRATALLLKGEHP